MTISFQTVNITKSIRRTEQTLCSVGFARGSSTIESSGHETNDTIVLAEPIGVFLHGHRHCLPRHEEYGLTVRHVRQRYVFIEAM